MKPIATALMLMLLLVGGANNARGARDVQTTAPTPLAIPFELANHLVILKASVNRSRPLSFVLDTGASVAIMRMDVAKELGLSLFGEVNVRGAGPGAQAGSRVRNAMWSLEGLERVAQPVALAIPLPELPTALGRDVDGIIGGEFIRQFVVELDYDARIIRFHDPKTFEYRGRGETLPLEFNSNGHPVVSATVTPSPGAPVEGRFLLDIGSGLPLALHSPFVQAHDLLAVQSKTIRAIGAGGAGGRSAGRLGRVTALRIGSFTLEQPITLFSEDAAGAFADATLAGNIGAQIANRFRMFLDYGRKRLILEPSSTFGKSYDRAFSGVALRAEGADYRTFRVREVLEDSPATDAGFQAGDIITSIDGTDAHDLTLASISELLEKPIAREIVVRRADQTVRLTLTPRPLI
jgi:hypothetical protein